MNWFFLPFAGAVLVLPPGTATNQVRGEVSHLFLFLLLLLCPLSLSSLLVSSASSSFFSLLLLLHFSSFQLLFLVSLHSSSSPLSLLHLFSLSVMLTDLLLDQRLQQPRGEIADEDGLIAVDVHVVLVGSKRRRTTRTLHKRS